MAWRSKWRLEIKAGISVVGGAQPQVHRLRTVISYLLFVPPAELISRQEGRQICAFTAGQFDGSRPH